MVGAVCDFAKGLVCDSQGSMGDLFIAPCRSYYKFFAKKVEASTGFSYAFWRATEIISCISYLVLAPLALVGGAVNMFFIPFAALHHYIALSPNLHQEEAREISTAPDKEQAIKSLFAKARNQLFQCTLKGQCVEECHVNVRFGHYSFKVKVWSAAYMTDNIFRRGVK